MGFNAYFCTYIRLWGLNSEAFPASVFKRSLLLAELEKEEKEKDWYYAQLQNLTKRIDSLPLTENVSTFSMIGHVSGAVASV